MAEIYNSFAIQEPLGVEALGFAEQGEGFLELALSPLRDRESNADL